MAPAVHEPQARALGVLDFDGCECDTRGDRAPAHAWISVPGESACAFGDSAALRRERNSRAVLRRLWGRTHEVWSGVAQLERGGERTAATLTRVGFRSIERHEDRLIPAYRRAARAGGRYAIYGPGAVLVAEIKGGYTCVVGLPAPALLELAPDLLRAAAASPGTGPAGG